MIIGLAQLTFVDVSSAVDNSAMFQFPLESPQMRSAC
jgi:hypothetical protein